MTGKERKRNRDGFTLIEIIVVVFILSLLVAIVAPRYFGETEKAQAESAKVQIRNLETALKLFKLDNGFYPTTEQGLEALVSPPTTGRDARNFRQGGYLEKRSVPKDPWENHYLYISPGVNGDFDIISLGADGMEGGEGYDADINNWEIN